jgi:long-chain-fatty-acyl-CoA reductase
MLMIKYVPMIIGGVIQDDPDNEIRELTLNNKRKVHLPIIDSSHVDKIIEIKVQNNLNLNQVVKFLFKVGQRW